MRRWKTTGHLIATVEDTEYDITITATFCESMEGQDADGNRGWLETSMDDYDVDDISPTPEDSHLAAIDLAVDLAIDEDTIVWDDPDGDGQKWAEADRKYDEMRERNWEMSDYEEVDNG